MGIMMTYIYIQQGLLKNWCNRTCMWMYVCVCIDFIHIECSTTMWELCFIIRVGTEVPFSWSIPPLTQKKWTINHIIIDHLMWFLRLSCPGPGVRHYSLPVQNILSSQPAKSRSGEHFCSWMWGWLEWQIQKEELPNTVDGYHLIES